jgi:hypothetical protein
MSKLPTGWLSRFGQSARTTDRWPSQPLGDALTHSDMPVIGRVRVPLGTIVF